MARRLLTHRAMWTIWLCTWLGMPWPMLPSLFPIDRYEAVLLQRLSPQRIDGLTRAATARHWLPRVRVYGNASAWGRVSFDDPSVDYRREGMSIGVSLEFNLPELAYDAEERALLAEARAARKEQRELVEALHTAWRDAAARLLHALSDDEARTEAVAAVRIVEAIAYGASVLAVHE